MAIKIEPDPKLKQPWTSKTLWVAAITSIAPLVAPPFAEWIQGNPDTFASSMGLVFLGLRLVTGGKVSVG